MYFYWGASYYAGHERDHTSGMSIVVFDGIGQQEPAMNILVLNWRDMKHPQAGGAEVHFHEIFRRFVKNGHSVVLCTTKFPGSSSQDVQDGIVVYRWGHTFFFNWEVPFFIRKICKRHPIDCVIDDVNKLPFFSPKWFPKMRCGVIFHHLFGNTVFGLAPYPFARYVLFMERLSFWGYGNTPCCTVSQSTALELAARGFNRESICIIENSVDTDRYTPDTSVKKEPNLLFYAGRLKKYKNIAIMLDAVKRLLEQGRSVRFVVAGAGDDEKDLAAYARRLGISDRVDFMGYVDEATKIGLYRRATLFVNPSRKEGWGITSIEAGACGAAVVANDVPGLRDSVRNGETGLLYKENDCDDLVRCILAVLDNNELRKSFEVRGRQWALGFSWNQSAIKMEQWLKETVCAK
jgi:glycosyltransferase involved in cell wall biosynthesis